MFDDDKPVSSKEEDSHSSDYKYPTQDNKNLHYIVNDQYLVEYNCTTNLIDRQMNGTKSTIIKT